MSQIKAVFGPTLKSWDDYRQGCLSTYGGGHHEEATITAFRHGMNTVFNLLEAEFPPAEVCKATADLQEAAEAMLRWFEAEDKHLGTFHDRMDLCQYVEWASRKALGEDVGEFEGVPRLIITREKP